MLCVDEKTCIQALERRRGLVLPRPGCAGRFEFEYRGHGTRALIAAFDVRTGKVFGQCRQRRTARDLADFMEQVAQRYPAGDVYIVWDNLNIHCGETWQRFCERHGGRFHFVHTPLHASWVNQVEIWFSILQRRVLKHGEFFSPQHLAREILAFIRYRRSPDYYCA